MERLTLAPGFTVSRVLTGLWQIADMERDGDALDPELTSDALAPYLAAGLHDLSRWRTATDPPK